MVFLTAKGSPDGAGKPRCPIPGRPASSSATAGLSPG